MEELLSQTGYAFHGYKRGQVVTGTIRSVSPKHVFMDIGGKSDAVVHQKEIPYITDFLSELKPGDKIKVHVVNAENDMGQIVVSLRRTVYSQRWEILDRKMRDEEEVEVTIKELSKGGFLVDYKGMRGFVPLSQAQQSLVRQGAKAAGRKINVKVIELNPGNNRLIFSQLTTGVAGAKQKQVLEKIEIGDIFVAEVTGIVPFGAFVTVHVSDEVMLPGLIHISEIAWEKVENPQDYLKAGEKREVKVIAVDKKTGKLTLSLKQLTSDPWEDVAKVLEMDQTVKGKVTRVSSYGVFVSLLPGIEGLIHISKMAPGEEPKVGEEVECMIEQIDTNKRKISLSLVTKAKPIGYR